MKTNLVFRLLLCLSLAAPTLALAEEVEPNFLATKTFDAAKLGDAQINMALFGDSLSHDFYTAIDDIESIKQMTTKRQGNWFLAPEDSKTVDSLFKIYSKETPTRAQIFARVSSYIKANNETPSLKKRFASVQDFHEQIATMLKEKAFPNLILCWIGHNNLDWNWDIVDKKATDPIKHRAAIPSMVAKAYRAQLDILVAKANEQKYPVVIVVYGLGNLPSFFEARALLQKERDKFPKDQKPYPSFEIFWTKFTSFTPEKENVTTELWKNTNKAISEMVKEIKPDSKLVKIVYSDAFAEIKIETKHLHKQDGFHLSSEGHSHFAKASAESLKEYLPLLKK